MAERGARPNVPKVRQRLLRAARAFTTPLLPDDYLEMINPLWSTRELRGRVERITRETEDAVTVEVRPGYEWTGHQPGQYLRVGFDIDGVRHWRAYSLTSEPGRPDGFISITPKLVQSGKVSPYVNRELKPGALVFLSDVEGEFVLPDPAPQKLLFISAGSGITPIMSMLRGLRRRGAIGDVVHLHSSRSPDEVIFGSELRALSDRHESFRLHEQHTSQNGRMCPADLDALCPDWREREAFVSGPAEMLDTLSEHWEREGEAGRLHMERFQPVIGGDGAEGEGGTIKFSKSGRETECDGGTPILVAGEQAGLELPFGCRMGICHTCVGRVRSGKLRDLRSGEVSDAEGMTCRICVNAPEGPVEIEL
ncbi:MAG TPA: ferredoxin reductase [Thermoleophilaceae bacterium]|jgi:ferredoxin-NADP reductase